MGVAADCCRWGDGKEEDDLIIRLLMSMKSERMNMFDRAMNAQDIIVHMNRGQDN